MKSDTKEVGKNTIIYGLGNALNKLLGFILIPIYTSFISISDFGVLAILEISVLAMIQLLNFGVIGGHQRYFYLKNEEGSYGKFLFSNYSFLWVILLVIIIPATFFSNQLSIFLFSKPDYSEEVLVTLAIIFLEVLVVIPFQILQFSKKPKIYIFYSFSKLALSLLFTIYFVVFQSMGIYGLLLGRLIGLIVIYFFQLVFIIGKNVKFKFDFQSISTSIQYGFPIILYSIGYIIFTFSDRYMLNWLSTEEQVGMYSFGYKMANFINLIFIQSIGMSYLPSIFENENKEDKHIFFAKMSKMYLVGMSVLTVGFLSFYKMLLIPFIKDDSYILGLMVVPIMSVSFIIHGLNHFINVGIFLKNKTKYLFYISIITASLNILLNFLLIPPYGFLGVAFATLISQFINTLLMGYFSNKLLPISLDYKSFILVFLVFSSFILYFVFVSFNQLWIELIINTLFFAIVLLVLYRFGTNSYEKSEINGLITNGFNRVIHKKSKV